MRSATLLSVLAALVVTACSRPETSSDVVLRIADPPRAPVPAALETAGHARAWAEPITYEAHGIGDVSLAFPKVHVPSERASEAISAHIHDWVMANADALERAAQDAASELVGDELDHIPPFSLTIACEPKVVRESLVSISCTLETYTGGAHGMMTAEAFNFAVEGDVARPIGIDDLFLDAPAGRKDVSDVCVAELSRQEALWVKAGNVTDVRDMLDAFHFEPAADGEHVRAIVVHFAPYEVGPYAEGEHAVEIPAPALRGLRPVWAKRFGG